MSGYVLLASYPKSGNTWLRFMIETVRRNGQPPDINEIGILNAAARLIYDRALDMETSDLSPAEIGRARPWVATVRSESEGPPPILKVHDANLTPPSGSSAPFPPEAINRVVYIARDPRDVAVSAAAHFGISIRDQVERLNNPQAALARLKHRGAPQLEQFISSWSNHVASWLDGYGYPLLLVRYEDMLADPSKELGRVISFLNMPTDPEVISSAVRAGAFKKLAAAEKASGFREVLKEASAPFFRRGVAGGWRDSLPADLALCIVHEHGAMMNRLGYEI